MIGSDFYLDDPRPADGAAVIVGAGPAGIRAAQTLLAHGVRPVVIDEAPKAGGQIYRRQPDGFARTPKDLYGFEAGRASALHQAFDSLRPDIDYRPDTLVWNAQGHTLNLLHTASRTADTVRWRDVIVATGATDRVLPIPGWTLPGVYTLGGAQVALKYQGCAIGDAVVFAGTGPLLYLVAYQYAKAGGKVCAVLDTAPSVQRYKAAPAMLAQPAVTAKGVYYVSWLMFHNVPVHHGVQLLRAEGGAGNERVQALVWKDAQGAEQRTACSAVGLGYALRPETQLPDLLGCEFAFAPLHRCHVPQTDADRRSSVPGVYLAGDGAGIMGADAAEMSGELAALALLQDRGIHIDVSRASHLRQRLLKTERFRQALEVAFPFPEDWAARASDDLVVCRCENITAGEIRSTAAANANGDINRIKALCRVGMGRCQGRMCGVAATEILADALQVPVESIGRIRGQAPIKPLPLDMTVAAAAREAAHG
ncbi:NADPH-dependent 2,4-dienoyl-CoA reductase/sulfur reductase-like enzyme [Comamonas odontotermitis]|uniref:NADPH-dependent 2,4-dienoyl-CoA reductase/sulfur reductase-like enzyme n=1 Tax=Comamonas odontotermitis TaxID=379895 RepID=A0ABR6RAP8_9BURK|nr:NAD(P)/FAD-dependent oxidoreductase [Comamonas odontotermitis]MBB6576209.1 NADPH-dependent 2,4-dienoyl-CoA reductase/sulfur reductase-like enzyme [Comamonas odontotermitis]